MKKVELNIIALSDSLSKPGNFALILEEQNGFRRLPIIIGPFEAQSIAVFLEKVPIERPMTHDLFKTTLDTLGAKLKQVLIHELKEDIFYARLIGTQKDGSSLEVDTRTSDAIAIALRFDCSIFTTEKIMQEASFILDSPSKSFSSKRGRLIDYSIEELEKLLKQVVAKEDYISATKIRDAIQEKKTKHQ
ncbi:MAG TPA: bifunctional nuclease family protein [Saprospiraceae bacterium]|nr:bifunctional nuclease family protein [Saprospiraceae bacterium]